MRQILSPRKRGLHVNKETVTPPSLRPAKNAGRSFRWGYNLTALRAYGAASGGTTRPGGTSPLA